MTTMVAVTGRLMLVDPMPAFCESLAAAFPRHGLHVAGWTTDELEAHHMEESLRPDIVLTEIALNGGSGIDLTRRLSDRCRVVVLTRLDIGDIVLDAVSAGAVGCLAHDLTVEQVAARLLQAEASFVHDPASLLAVLRRAGTLRAAPAVERLGSLTAREDEVLRLLAEGLDDDGIAASLFLSPNTVRTHVGRILRKLQVHTRADAIRVALAGGSATGNTTSADIARITGPDLERG